MVLILTKVLCRDHKPDIEKYEIDGDFFEVSVQNGILPQHTFHEWTSICLVTGHITIVNLRSDETVDVFTQESTAEASPEHTREYKWIAMRTDEKQEEFQPHSAFSIVGPGSRDDVYGGIARRGMDSRPGLEYFFYLEDTERVPLQTARIVLEGTIKIATALISAPDHIWMNDSVRMWKDRAIQNINNILKLYKHILSGQRIPVGNKKDFEMFRRWLMAPNALSMYGKTVTDSNFAVTVDALLRKYDFFDKFDSFCRTNDCLPADNYSTQAYFE